MSKIYDDLSVLTIPMLLDCRNFREGFILENVITIALLYYIYCMWTLIVIITCWNCQTWVLWTCWDPWWSGEVCQDMRRKHSQAGTRSPSHNTGVLILSVDYSWLYCTIFILYYSLSTDASLWNVTLREKIYLVLFTGFSHAPVCESSGPRLLVESSSLVCTHCTTLYTLYNTVHRAKYNSLANTMWTVQILINNDFAMLIGIKYQRELNLILL